MATLPLILSLTDELDALSSRFDNNLGLGYYHHRPHHHIHHPALSLVGPAFNYIQNAKASKKESAAPIIGKDGFQVCMDVQLFKPNELTVKVIDNSIVVEGKHEEREDEHGGIYRHFIRRYVLPEGYDQNEVVSTLSSDGILTVKVPAPQKTETKERIIHIQHTGPAHLSVKDNESEEKKAEEEEK